ncbi:ROK family protein [Fundicoccus sp. Sow4_H7]|uniref:ROK family protein n=1 Tax=Fundicoccus sp. Sow4_H7 TaxID=3438784 RepID=UPI003F8E3E9F
MILAVFDIGGTSVKYGIWKNETLEHQDMFMTPESWEVMKSKLKEAFQQLEKKMDKKLDGAAFSCPGAVNPSEGVIYGFSAVPYMHLFPIKDELTQLLGVPVTIENDANCAALAELTYGAASDVDNVLFIIIGSGIGGSVILNRQLIRGRNLFGGEFGFMLLENDRSFSDLASPVRVAYRYAEELGLQAGEISGKEMFQRADSKEALAMKYVESLKDGLARGIQTLLVALNPDKVVIGGAISSRQDLIDEVSERIKQLLVQTNASDVEANILACRFNNDANLIGAVIAFLEQRKRLEP